jgi:hypothetical protein
MKKLLGTTLALAMLLPAGANAELLKNLKVTGKIDLQGTAARNVRDFQTNVRGDGTGSGAAATNGQDRIGDMQTRVLVSADWDLLDDVHARVTIRKNDRVWGNSSQALVTGALNAFEVDESFIKIDKLMGSLDTTLGRQFVGEEGDLVAYYGPRTNLYGLGVDALDAAKFDWSNEHLSLTALTGKATANAASLGTAASGQQDVRAVILGCKGHEMIQGKVYLWNQATHNATGPVGTNPGATAGAKNDNLYVAGIKVNVKAGPAWLKAEFDKNYGENRQTLTATNHSDRKYTGWATLLNAGAKVEAGSLGMLTGWGEFGYGTGSSDGLSNVNSGFTSINTDYRPGSLYGRFAQNVTGTSFADSLDGVVSGGSIAASNGLSNRVVKGVGVKLTPAAVSKLTVALSAWDFHFAHTGRKGQGVGAQPEIGANGNRHIGNEFDLEFAWQHSENVLVKVGAASFQSGGWVKETQKINNITTGTNPAYMLTSDVSVRF